MAAVTNTVQTYGQKGIREDLSDVIYNIDPTSTPFMSNAGRESADNTLFEWQIDDLAAPDNTNAQIEGDDLTAFDAASPTDRLGNYTQISRKSVIVAGTVEAVKRAGRKSEMAYQTAKRGKELKRDMEQILVGTNQGGSAASGTTARKTASVLAFIKTNVNLDTTSGANPVYTSVPTTGRTDSSATRALSEDLVKDVLQQGFTNGADFDMLMVDAKNKQVVSGFSGIATKTYQMTSAKKAAIIGAADIYVSDFGVLTVAPSRYIRHRDALLLDFEYISVAYLRPFRRDDLAKTGDATKAMLLVEYGLKVKHEKALGGVFDLA